MALCEFLWLPHRVLLVVSSTNEIGEADEDGRVACGDVRVNLLVPCIFKGDVVGVGSIACGDGWSPVDGEKEKEEMEEGGKPAGAKRHEDEGGWRGIKETLARWRDGEGGGLAVERVGWGWGLERASEANSEHKGVGAARGRSEGRLQMGLVLTAHPHFCNVHGTNCTRRIMSHPSKLQHLGH